MLTSSAAAFDLQDFSPAAHAVAMEAHRGLTQLQKTLPPWLFYDQTGSELFEEITRLPEYYLTRTERDLFTTHAADIFAELGLSSNAATDSSADDATAPAPQFEDAAVAPRPSVVPFLRHLTVMELGAGTAAKTGVLLRELARLQRGVLYQPVDISPSALAEASTQLRSIRGITIQPHVANYTTQRFSIARPAGSRVLALYIGSSIGNFSPAEARDILTRLRAQLSPGDSLLLGVDLAPCLAGTTPPKQIATLLAAYNDAAGVTAAFNRNVLVRLNREIGTDFELDRFAHRALWNPTRSRIEMHLVSLTSQNVTLPRTAAGPAVRLHFAEGETIHTENSYKFTPAALAALLGVARFAPKRTFTDPQNLFSVVLACAE